MPNRIRRAVAASNRDIQLVGDVIVRVLHPSLEPDVDQALVIDQDGKRRVAGDLTIFPSNYSWRREWYEARGDESARPRLLCESADGDTGNLLVSDATHERGDPTPDSCDDCLLAMWPCKLRAVVHGVLEEDGDLLIRRAAVLVGGIEFTEPTGAATVDDIYADLSEHDEVPTVGYRLSAAVRHNSQGHSWHVVEFGVAVEAPGDLSAILDGLFPERLEYRDNDAEDDDANAALDFQGFDDDEIDGETTF